MEIISMNQAMQIHAQILKLGTQKDLSKLFTFSALSPSGDISYAELILHSLPSPNSYHFNTMIRAYSQSPNPTQALLFFISMHQDPTHHLPRPDKFTYPFLLKSCARLRLTHVGKQLHGLVLKSDLALDHFVQNSLIHMYSECGDPDLAYIVFDRMYVRDVVSWTSIIDGLVNNDMSVKAISLFEQMTEEGIEVNDATIVSVLKACADSGALSLGRRVHYMIEEMGLDLKSKVSTALIDMYSKCGSINSAKKVFNKIVSKDVFAWTAIISGLANYGLCKEANDLFNEMRDSNVKPDERTMTAVLSACRNAGWVSEGFSYLNNMKMKYGIGPTIQHYGCMVDLLARARHLEKAEEVIRTMPIEPDEVLWRTLIWACKVYGDTDRSERLIKHLQLVKKSLHDCGSYVLLGNVYASAGKWNDKAKVREMMTRNRVVKPKGSSKIEINGVINEFSAGDTSHFEAERIYAKLDEINARLRQEGYKPNVSCVLLEIGDEEKSLQLQHHSEKLAVAYGLIKTSPSGSVIRIVKNLRSCEDCHEVMKIVSKMYGREIIMRDRIRFHHFSYGECSCKDYW